VRLATRFALASVTVAVLVLLAGLGLLRLVRVDVRNDLDAGLRAQAVRLRPVAVRALAQPGPPAAPTGLTPPDDGGVALYGNGGWVAAGTHPPLDTLPATGTGLKSVLANGTLWRAAVVNVPQADGGRGRLWVFAPPGEPARELDRLRLRVGVVTLLAVPIAGLAGWLVGRAATRPLRRLQHRLASVSSGGRVGGDAARRVGGGSGVPEIDEVAAVVDSTLDRYDGQVALTNQALQTARSFAAAAAHELRTPLAGIGTNLEVLQRHGGIDAAERDEILADLVAEHRRAVGLLAMLRVLAQGELITPAQFERVDLAELVDAAADAARRRHPQAALFVHGPPSVPVTGWPDGLRCILDNLLDNAAVHGRNAATGRATIRVTLTPDATLSIVDDGPGVPVERRQEVFARFAKSPNSPGSGLGLALVAQQVALHGGTIEVGPPPGGSFRVRLPQIPT
jgi:two-component system, OmpR family, sensor histidine kinase PrrB